MNRFEMLVDEFKTKLGRDLSQKELEWIKWVVDRENRGGISLVWMIVPAVGAVRKLAINIRINKSIV